MKLRILVIGILLVALGIAFYKFFNQSNKMEDVLAYKLKLPELKGVKINLSEIFDIKYTCDGENINPKIVFPDNGVYAVILEDPDAPAGTWFHWGIIIWNSTEIPEGFPKVSEGENFYQTYNDFYYHNFTRGNIKGVGYDGPCPPRGHGYHRYFFEVFKLKKKPDRKIIEKEDLYEFIRENAEGFYVFVAKYKR